ncbi:MAG: hypothetical protein ACYTKD_21615, partial [Planctomycetota bacterium]
MRSSPLRFVVLLFALAAGGLSCVSSERDGAATTPGGIPDGGVDGDILQWDTLSGAWEVQPAPGGTGTVTSVDAAEGLETVSGLPVTATGTIRIADGGVTTAKLADGAVTPAKLDTTGASSGDVLTYNGASWVLLPAGTGTVTSVSAGDGLVTTGGLPITTTGTVDLDLAPGEGLSKAMGTGTQIGIAVDGVTSAKIQDGTVAAADLSDMGATGADQVLVWNGAAWAPGSVTSAVIGNGEIVDADIAAGAAIDPAKISGTAWTSTNDGTGTGLDADTLDTLHAADLLDKATYDTNDDGVVESALNATNATNADTLDTLHAADLLDKATYDAGGVAGVVDLAESATTAGDADTVDGAHAADLLDKATYDAGGVPGVVDLAETATTAGDAGTLDSFDSTEFAVLDGQPTGQTLHGGTASGEMLTLRGTFAGDGDVVIADDAGYVGIGTIAPASKLDVNGTVTATAFAG